MLKIFGPSICKSLEMIFNERIETCAFSSKWKKGHIATIHKKGDKQKLKDFNSRPLLLI